MCCLRLSRTIFMLHECLAEAEAELEAREARLNKLVNGPRKEEIEVARAGCDWAQAALDKAVAGPRPQEIKIAEAKLARVEAELLKAQKDHARVKKLFDSEQAADEEMDEAQRALSVARANAAQACDELKSGPPCHPFRAPMSTCGQPATSSNVDSLTAVTDIRLGSAVRARRYPPRTRRKPLLNARSPLSASACSPGTRPPKSLVLCSTSLILSDGVHRTLSHLLEPSSAEL